MSPDFEQRLIILRQNTTLTDFDSFKTKKGLSYVRMVAFPLITFILVLAILIFNLTLRTYKTLESVEQRRNYLIEKVLLTFESPPNLQQTYWDEMRSELKSISSPLTEFFGVDPLINRDIDRITLEIQEWQKIINPLRDFQFSGEGFISITQRDRLFTDALYDFFSQAAIQYRQSIQIWNSLWYYRILIRFVPSLRIQELFSFFEEVLDVIDYILLNNHLVLEILGHYSRQRFLLFTQNTGEARPTGGFLGSFLSVEFVKGQMTIGKSESIYLFDDVKRNAIISHPATSYYAPGQGDQGFDQGIRNLNYFQCFPITAELIEDQWVSSGNERAVANNAIIFITPFVLESLLPPGFSFFVPEIGTLNIQNIIQEVERLTSIEAESRENIKAPISIIFQTLLSQLPAIISQTGYFEFLVSFIDSILARDVQVWFKNNNIQKLSSDFGLASDALCNMNDNYKKIGFLLSNLSSDKRNSEAINEFNIWSKSVPFGQEITITYKQKFEGRPFLQRGFNDFAPMAFVGLQVPNDAWDFSISSPQILDLPLERPFTEVTTLDRQGDNIVIPDKINVVRLSAKEIQGGFTYVQPDGSRVIGTYIEDIDSVSQVSFTFKVPYHNHDSLTFYGQSGLHNPVFSIGKGMVYHPRPHVEVIKDRITIQKGIPLSLHQTFF